MADLKEINVILGTNIKLMRKKYNITREQLAEMINVSPRFLADVESGKVGVSLITLKHICKALSISADFLLGISEFDEKNIIINSIENKINSLCVNTLENLDKIIDCIIEIESD